jgi:hypothetical protein
MVYLLIINTISMFLNHKIYYSSLDVLHTNSAFHYYIVFIVRFIIIVYVILILRFTFIFYVILIVRFISKVRTRLELVKTCPWHAIIPFN